jgi:hypothetical protein
MIPKGPAPGEGLMLFNDLKREDESTSSRFRRPGSEPSPGRGEVPAPRGR